MMRTVSAAAVCCCVLAGLSVATSVTAQQPQTVTVSGTVVAYGSPVAGAQVRMSNGPASVETVTDSAGRFRQTIAAGFVRLEFQPSLGSGLAADRTFLQLTSDVTLEFDLYRSMNIAGTVRTAAGVPAAARIEVVGLVTNRGAPPVETENGTFNLPFHEEPFSIVAFPRDPRLHPAHMALESSSGTRTVTLVIPDEALPLIPNVHTPIVERIEVTAPDANGQATITGAAGAVPGVGTVAVANLDTVEINFTASHVDGSFSLPMFAPGGSHLSVRFDPTGRRLGFGASSNGFLDGPPATMLYVVPPAAAAGVSAGVASAFHERFREEASYLDRLAGAPDIGNWWMTVSIEKDALAPGTTLRMSGRLFIFSRDLNETTETAAVALSTRVFVNRVIDAEGFHRRTMTQFSSTVLTPAGAPIDRHANFGSGLVSRWQSEPLRRAGAHLLETTFTLEADIPASFEAGLYEPVVQLSATGIPFTGQRHRGAYMRILGGNAPPRLPLIRIGDPKPARLYWILGLDDFGNGARGNVAREDRGRVQVDYKVKNSPETLTLPWRDRSGSPIRYRLEPHVPLVSSGLGRLPSLPQIAFKFPSGTLEVTVIAPDGRRHELGSAPFRQPAMRAPISRRGLVVSGLSARPSDYFALTTNDTRFEYAFPTPGRYQVVMRGTIEDISGNRYNGGGTYDIDVGELLNIDTAVLPGTPFQVGDHWSAAITLQPPVPATVEVRFRLFPDSDPASAIESLVVGRANRFGRFTPREPFRITAAGEYRIDVAAHYSDPAGMWWSGAERSFGIVETPLTTVVAHGRRGFDATPRIQEPWMFLDRVPHSSGHLFWPFHNGDVIWLRDTHPSGTAVNPTVTVQDNDGALVARIRSRNGQHEPPGLDERITAGEVPLFSSSSAGTSAEWDERQTDHWGYFYVSVQRPAVHVRELVAEDFGGKERGYWRFDDNYQFQLGSGVLGDLPNDFKFQFGGAVYRVPTENFFYYGAYASLFVLIRDDDSLGPRVTPPFQGNGGGPNGGPLFTLKGRPIDLFFHPTGIRPGSLLHEGETASFVGYAAPTLPARVEIVLISPSGAQRTIRGQTNKIGYFHDPAQDIRVDEPGVWRASVKIVFDGRHSAGQVTPPFPSGDILGSREGEFYFYVVRADAEPLQIVSVSPRPLGAGSRFLRPADGPISFSLMPPAALTNVEMHYTVTMPGFILDEGRTTQLSYTYDAQSLARDFPNLDLHDPDGFAGADTITMSFLVSGSDASGARKHFARQIVIQGEDLQTPEQKAQASVPRRRAVRH